MHTARVNNKRPFFVYLFSQFVSSAKIFYEVIHLNVRKIFQKISTSYSQKYTCVYQGVKLTFWNIFTASTKWTSSSILKNQELIKGILICYISLDFLLYIVMFNIYKDRNFILVWKNSKKSSIPNYVENFKFNPQWNSLNKIQLCVTIWLSNKFEYSEFRTHLFVCV